MFNEDSRVKLPALIHFKRLGYIYQSKKNTNVDCKNNVFVDVFKEAINRINNNNYSDVKIHSMIDEITRLTDNTKDKGQAFYERLVTNTGPKLIDLKNPLNNDFRVVSELTYKRGEKEFRLI